MRSEVAGDHGGPAGRSGRLACRTMWQLQNTVRHYPWGSRTVIPELLGEPAPADRPYAELWMGAHPDEPSVLLRRHAAGQGDRAASPSVLLGAPSASGSATGCRS